MTEFGTNGIYGEPIRNLQFVNNTNLHPFLHHFQVIADYWSNFCFPQEIPLFNTLLCSECLNLALKN